MRFICAAGIQGMQSVNNGQSHNRCPGKQNKNKSSAQVCNKKSMLCKEVFWWQKMQV